MKRSSWVALDSLLAVAAIAAAGLNLLGPGLGREAERRPALGVSSSVRDGEQAAAGGAPGAAGEAAASAPGSAEAPASRTLPPAAIARALGWSEPPEALAAAPAEAPGEAQAEPAILESPWLTLIGSVTGADGERFYFFKNARTGGVLRLSPSRPIEGWTITVVGAGECLVAKDGERYRVRLR